MTKWNLNLKKLRKQWGMSQEELACRLGISRPTLNKIENKERKINLKEEKKIEEIFCLIKDDKNLNKGGIRISIPQKNLKKFEQTLLYLLEKVGSKPNVGMTVLYKLLYFIDFDYYEKYEDQLMGLTYFKNHHGPAPREFVKVIEEMKRAKKIEEIKSKFFKYDQKKFLPLVKPDLSLLSGQELELIDNVIERYGDKTANEISDISHQDIPWAVAEEGENLEYDHVFYRSKNISVREFEEL
jgi:transcriptional regulator with XRE-family HTH domain